MHFPKGSVGSTLAMMMVAAAAVGCAGRTPAPVAVVQAQDRYMDCPAILVEVTANNQRLSDLASEQGWKVAQNVGAGVAGLFIWPLWFGMDFQGAAGKEAAALQSRQQYLAVLAEQRHCGEPEHTPKADAEPPKKKKVTTTNTPPTQAASSSPSP
jgi:carbohydrate-selective porin OprB